MSDRILPALVLGLVIAVGGFVAADMLLGLSPLATYSGLIATLLGLAIFFAIFLFLQTGGERWDVNKRVQVVRDRNSRKKEASLHKDRIVANRNKISARAAQTIVRYLGLSGEKMPAVKLALLRAGYIGENALLYYTMAKVLMPILGLALGGLTGYWYTDGEDAVWIAIWAVGGALLASFAIEFFLRQRAKERMQKIWEDMPDSIDLMVIYTETGATIDTALPRIVNEIRDQAPELAQEYEILSSELRLQTDRSKAYDNLLRRADLPSVKSFVSIVKQSETIGTPVTKALSALSGELRRERMLIAERRAARIPVLITLPLMIFIMPALFIIVLGPTALRIIEIFRTRF